MKAYLSDSSHKRWWLLAWDFWLQEPVLAEVCKLWGSLWEPAIQKRWRAQTHTDMKEIASNVPSVVSPLSDTLGHDHLQHQHAPLAERTTWVENQAENKTFTENYIKELQASYKSSKIHTNRWRICREARQQLNVHDNHVSTCSSTIVSEWRGIKRFRQQEQAA